MDGSVLRFFLQNLELELAIGIGTFLDRLEVHGPKSLLVPHRSSLNNRGGFRGRDVSKILVGDAAHANVSIGISLCLFSRIIVRCELRAVNAWIVSCIWLV